MQWCDLAIAASGLTKYELAATATPALLFSIDAFHHESNRSFAATETAIDLGTHVTAGKIADEVAQLLRDPKLRTKLSTNGRQTIDGHGVQRLLIELLKELSCLKPN
jgi:spore coat polysaccharide biosynthesis predicted glycosyltransferase SpsG